jgi:hypothetical protein
LSDSSSSISSISSAKIDFSFPFWGVDAGGIGPENSFSKESNCFESDFSISFLDFKVMLWGGERRRGRGFNCGRVW